MRTSQAIRRDEFTNAFTGSVLVPPLTPAAGASIFGGLGLRFPASTTAPPPRAGRPRIMGLDHNSLSSSTYLRTAMDRRRDERMATSIDATQRKLIVGIVIATLIAWS